MTPDTAPVPTLPRRPDDGHKGTFGTVVVVGGCAAPELRMIGAPALSARAALRAGCGLAKLVVPSPIADAVLGLCPSATAVPLACGAGGAPIAHLAAETLDAMARDAACVVIGPGMAGDDTTAAIAVRALGHAPCPLVIDAGALAALALVPDLARDVRAAAVLTPHPGEYGRLADALALREDPVDPARRPAAAEALAQRLGCVVALKGARTVVSDGHRTWINDTGGPELATGGTGDVLAGLIAGLVAQFVREEDPIAALRRRVKGGGAAGLSLYDAVRVAVRAHGAAGTLWRSRHAASAGLLAQELADLIPEALEPMRG